MAQERFDLRFASAKSAEIVECRPATATGQDFAEEALARAWVEGVSSLLESGVAVGRKHLGPFVAVLARGVAAGKNVRETVRETVPFRRGDDRHLAAHLGQQIERGARRGGGILGV